MRIALFFLWFLGFGIGLPALVMGLIKLRAKPPFVVDGGALRVDDGAFADPAKVFADPTTLPPTDVRAAYPGTDAATMGIFPDGTRALVMQVPDAKTGNDVVRSFYANTAVEKPKQTEREAIVKTAAGETAVVFRYDPYVFIGFGPDEPAARTRLKSIRGIAPNPDRTAGNKFDAEWKPYVLAAVLAWAAFIGLQFCRMASWAGSVTPYAQGALVETTSAKTLRQRLLAINEQNVPWAVTESPDRPDELIVDWRYADATWMDHLRVHKMRKAYRLTLRLDDAGKTVRAREYESALDLGAGAGGARLNWKGSLGIQFVHYQRETVFGLQFKDGGPTADTSYTYTFNLRELKQPIIDAVTDAGWTYRPVLTFFRPIGG